MHCTYSCNDSGGRVVCFVSCKQHYYSSTESCFPCYRLCTSLLTVRQPYNVFAAVLPGALDPSKCTCSGEGLTHATAGQPTSFRVHTLDLHGNTRTQGGDTFTVSALLQGDTGPSSGSLHGTVEDLGQGIYRAAYTATAAGTYKVSLISSDGEPDSRGISELPAMLDCSCSHCYCGCGLEVSVTLCSVGSSNYVVKSPGISLGPLREILSRTVSLRCL